MKFFLTALLTIASAWGAHPGMIAHYRFESDGDDATTLSLPLQSDGLRFHDGALDLTAAEFPSYVNAPIPGATYNAISVAVDIKPSPFSTELSPILSCGPLYRWLDINAADGFLEVALNNSSMRYRSTKAIATDHWQTVVVSIDWFDKHLLAWIDGERVLSSEIVGDNFDVVGTVFEQSDKVVCFRNNAFGTRYLGLADNLRVFNRPLFDSDLAAIFSPKLEVQRFQSGVLVAWPMDATGYELETTTGLASTWAASISPQTQIGDLRLIVVNDAETSAAKFFRLRRN